MDQGDQRRNYHSQNSLGGRLLPLAPEKLEEPVAAVKRARPVLEEPKKVVLEVVVLLQQALEAKTPVLSTISLT